MIPLDISVVGDVTVIAYHARSTFGGKVQGKVRERLMLDPCIFGRISQT